MKLKCFPYNRPLFMPGVGSWQSTLYPFQSSRDIIDLVHTVMAEGIIMVCKQFRNISTKPETEVF